jgi:general secretion pathway protein D
LSRPGATPPGFSVRVIPLKYVRAADLKPVLDPFTPAGGALQADNNRNLLVVSGSSSDLDGFEQLARQFDTDWLSGKSFGIYPLHVGKVKDVTTALQAILDQGADGSGPLSGLVRVVPVERLNAVLAITSRPAYLAQIKSWVDRLDYGDADATPRFFKYQVQKTRAADLARVLRQLFSSGEVKIVPPEKSPLPNFTRLATATSTSQGTAGGVSSAIPGVPGSGALPIAAPVPQPAPEDQQQSGAGAGAAAIVPGEGLNQLELPPVRIVADEKNNTLVIFARPRDYRMIEGMLQQLDVEPRQVMIEATVAELTLNDQLQYGVQYFLKAGAQRFELSTSKSGTLGPADIAGLFPGFNYIVATSTQQAILSLLKSITTVTVLSAPQLLVRDHQTAGLQVGAQVPIVIQSSQSTISPNAPVINSVEYRNTGVILEVTPRINADGMITLDVDQEVSDVAQTTSSTIDSPTINDRHLVSSIQVQDGETIALGGLIREDTNDTKGGIPVLSDIPVVGPLFRSTSRSKGRTELLVLLSPRLIKNTNDARAMTEDLRSRIQGLKPLERKTR